jgi:hypothetical protein
VKIQQMNELPGICNTWRDIAIYFSKMMALSMLLLVGGLAFFWLVWEALGKL